ncbi:LptA/OstA family protein [Arcobacter sp. FWKO B]|uniref:LptA/OstA family protein n=1 Tax=Arcobacter sp. FWKO B TaxID=2593672 RepID=UPI0018A58222|nr:LptA/OstA family protein [Arcobacter sp. FWKO B]QOG12985.1 lipopolysaccharide transport periplasmic protein LptA [Arcobacter sp. FWKO B]
MRFFIGLVVLSVCLFADNKLIIDANHFEGNDQDGIVIFTGNVKVTKVKDKLNSDRLEVEMVSTANNEKTPKKYTATGNVDFLVYANEKIYVGRGTKVIYEPLNNKYTILGNGYLEEKVDGRQLYGKEIYLDEITGRAEVVGDDKKPVRFIMKLDENQKEGDIE